jgi:predicted nucleotide-binding protein (sugar kinase/HSP70/actin superfamily)
LDLIVIDSPGEIGRDELLKRIGRISEKSTKSKLGKMKALYDALKVLKLIDEIDAIAHEKAGYERIKGQSKSLLNKCKSHVMRVDNPHEMISALTNYRDCLNKIEIDEHKNPVKVAIIGEIYTIIEPFSNLFIEDKLMDYGVVSKRRLTPSWWIKNLIMSPMGINSKDIKRASKDYLPLCVGGHARECIGEAVLAQQEGFDGAIQIFPMGCMPEIVAKSILPAISKEKDFPIMTLVVDEMTGEAGYITRIEAFIDLLERRKENVLSWN